MLSTASEHGARLVVLDTAPHAEQPALVAARAADLVLFPCRASILDLRAVTVSHQIAVLAKTPTAAVLNAVPSRGGLGVEAQDGIEAQGLVVAPKRLGQRVDFVHAATHGLGAREYRAWGKAAGEIRELYRWLLRFAREVASSS